MALVEWMTQIPYRQALSELIQIVWVDIAIFYTLGTVATSFMSNGSESNEMRC